MICMFSTAGKHMICIGESAEIKISSPKPVKLVQAVLIHTALTRVKLPTHSKRHDLAVLFACQWRLGPTFVRVMNTRFGNLMFNCCLLLGCALSNSMKTPSSTVELPVQRRAESARGMGTSSALLAS